MKRRVLFVDDEQNILDGLKRMLHSQHSVWDMAFISSGEQALAAMEIAPFDVVVSDMMMPGMSGAELFAQVKERYPRTIRIVLTGHADMESSMRSAFVSHQFLSKPCDANALRSVVARACDLEAVLQHPRLQEALGSVGELPVVPEVYRDLTVALAEEDVDIKRVGDIVEQDAGIVAKILQLVNSSYFGVSKPMTDVRQAAVFLGVTTIRDLVLSFEMFRQFDDLTNFSGYSLEREQSHSLLTARVARRLLDDKVAVEQAFLAAMLHDIGKLVLAAKLAEPFQTILQAGAGTERPFHTVEEEVLGVSHAEIGAYLLGLWGLEHSIVEAVAHHHRPARAPDQGGFGVVGATHVADALAREQDGSEPQTIVLDEEYLQAVGVLEKLTEWRAIAAEEAQIALEAA